MRYISRIDRSRGKSGGMTCIYIIVIFARHVGKGAVTMLRNCLHTFVISKSKMKCHLIQTSAHANRNCLFTDQVHHSYEHV